MSPDMEVKEYMETFDSGARRDTRAGKGRFDLLPPGALKRVANVFEDGAFHYGDRNWEKGMPVSRYVDSALRHIFQVLDGRTDEDHLAHAAWNLLAAMQTQEWARENKLKKELLDVPNGTAAKDGD